MSNSPTPAANPTWFDLLLGGGFIAVAINGTIVPQVQVEHVLNFVNAFTAADNPTTGSIDLTFTGASSGGPPTGVDVVGADLAHVYVGSISGFGNSGGTVALNIAQLQWASTQTAVSFTQATAPVNVAPANWTFTSQAPNAGSTGAANQTPGSFIFNVPALIGSGNYAGFIISQNGSPFFRIDAGTAKNGPSDPLVAFWMGTNAATPSSTNWLFAWDPINLTMSFSAPATTSGGIEMTSAGSIFMFTGSTAGSSLSLIAGGATTGPVYVTIGADLTGATTMNIGAAALTGNRHVSVLNEPTSANITATNLPNGDGFTFVANAASVPTTNTSGSPYLYATAGNLWCFPSGGTAFQIGSGGGGSVTWLHDLAGSNSTTGQWVAGLSGNGGTTAAIPLRSGAFIEPTRGQPIIEDSSAVTYLSTTGSGILQLNSAGISVRLQIGGTTQVSVDATDVALESAITSLQVLTTADFTFGFNGTVAGTASNLWLQGQQSTGGQSGNVNARVYAPGSGTTEAMFQVMRNSGGTDTMVWAFGRETTSNSGMWAHGVTPSANNYAMIAGSSAFLNGPSVAVGLQVAGATIGQWQASSADFLQFGASPASFGYLRVPQATSSTVLAASTQNLLSFDSNDYFQIGDTGLTVSIVFGNTSTFQIVTNGSAILTASQTLVEFIQQIDMHWAGVIVTSATSGSASSLPGTPAGYAVLKVSGTAQKFPFYN